MSGGNKKTVNINVEADVWDGIDGNRSEICRQALRAEAEMAREAGDVMRYAGDYEEAKQEMKELQTQIDVKRQMLYNELEEWGYDEYILPDDIPQNMGTFEETIVFSSQYAETYLNADKSKKRVVKLIRRDMNQEGRRLPEGIAEWVVEQVQERI